MRRVVGEVAEPDAKWYSVSNAEPSVIASRPGNLLLFGAISQFRRAKQDCGP
jgi:hypothetical protein